MLISGGRSDRFEAKRLATPERRYVRPSARYKCGGRAHGGLSLQGARIFVELWFSALTYSTISENKCPVALDRRSSVRVSEFASSGIGIRRGMRARLT